MKKLLVPNRKRDMAFTQNKLVFKKEVRNLFDYIDLELLKTQIKVTSKKPVFKRAS